MTLWTTACLAPLLMEFSRERILEWVLLPSPGDFPYLGIKHKSPALQVDLYHLSHQI